MAPRRGRSGAVGPGRQVRALLGRQLVDLYAHRRELEAGDLAVDLAWHAVHLLCQAPTVFDHVLGGQGLVREAHVHDGRGMPLGGGQVDEAALAEDVEPPSITASSARRGSTSVTITWAPMPLARAATPRPHIP